MEKKFESAQAAVVSTYAAVDVEQVSAETLCKASCDPPCQ